MTDRRRARRDGSIMSEAISARKITRSVERRLHGHLGWSFLEVTPDATEDVITRGDRRLLRALNHRALIRLHEERERVPHRHLARPWVWRRHPHAVQVRQEAAVGPSAQHVSDVYRDAPGTGSTGAHSVELVRGFAAHSSPNSPVRWNSRVTQHQSVCAPALQLPGGNAATRSADIGG